MTSKLLQVSFNTTVDYDEDIDLTIQLTVREMSYWKEFEFKHYYQTYMHMTAEYSIKMVYTIEEKDYLRLKLLDDLPKCLVGARITVYVPRPDSDQRSN